MSRIIIGDKILEVDIYEALKKIKNEIINGKLGDIKIIGDSISVPCPFHKNGLERHNSCTIYCGDGDLPAGSFHCFTCSESGSFAKFVGACFDKDKLFGEQWLLENYSYNFLKREVNLPIIDLEAKEEEKYLDESILEGFSDYHPYMSKRKLTDEIIKKFDIKYDPVTKSLVFPVRDINGKISFLTRRSTEGKKFIIDKGIDKKYLYCLDKIDYSKPVYLTESQINCLTIWQYGFQSVALYGAGVTDEQLKVLNNLPIKQYIIAFDPDLAGYKGAKRLCLGILKNKFVDVLLYNIPGKDINDLSEDEFKELKVVDRADFLNLLQNNKLL